VNALTYWGHFGFSHPVVLLDQQSAPASAPKNRSRETRDSSIGIEAKFSDFRTEEVSLLIVPPAQKIPPNLNEQMFGGE
jgi:hypothetical protein